MSELRKKQVLSKIEDVSWALVYDVQELNRCALDSLIEGTEYIDGRFVDIQRSYEMLCDYFEELWILKEVKEKDNDGTK